MRQIRFLFHATKDNDLLHLEQYIKSKGVDFTSREIDRKIQLKRALKGSEWDILFINGSSPSFNLVEALNISVEIAPLLPKIVYFDKIDEGSIVTAMRYGATDIIMLNNLPRLIPAIQNCLNNVMGMPEAAGARRMLEKYDFIINTSRSFLTLIDRKYRYKAVNEAFTKSHNLIKSEILGKPLVEIWGKEKFEDFIKPRLDECFENREVSYKSWFSTPTLGLRYFEVRYFPYKDDQGEVSHVIVETQDITKEKNLEEKITQGDSEVLSLLEYSTDLFWSLDTSYRITYTNSLFKNAFLQSYNKVLERGSEILKLLPSGERKDWKKKYTRCLKGEQVSFELSVPVGSEFIYYDVHLNPVFGSHENVIGISCLARDVTDRKKFLTEIKTQKEDLTLINDLNVAVNSGMSYQKILGILNDATKKTYGGLGAVVYLLSDDGKILISKGKMPVSSEFLGMVVEKYGIKVNELKIDIEENGYYADILESGLPKLADTPKVINKIFNQFINQDINQSILSEGVKLLNVKSILSIPLVSDSNPLGVMDISKSEAFTEEEVTRILKIADQVTSILKRKIDEEALRTSEGRFRNLFESANDAILIIEGDSFIDCNSKALELFRCEMIDIIGKTPYDFSPEKQPDGNLSSAKSQMKIDSAYKGKTGNFEWVHRRMDDSEIITEVSLSLIDSVDGTYILALLRDITIRKESEKLLRESEERFRAIFEDAPDALVLADPSTGFILDLNQSAIKLFNRGKAEVIGEHFTILHPDEQKSQVEKVFFKQGWNQPFNMDKIVFVQHKDGTKIPVEIHGKNFKYAGKNVAQGAFRDFSKQYETQKKLQQQDYLLTETQRIAHLGTWMVNLKTKSIFWSDETYKILGYNKEESSPGISNFLNRVHPDDRTSIRNKVVELIKNRSKFETSFRLLKENGEIGYVFAKTEALYNPIENSEEILGSFHDITDLKNVETALSESEGKFRTIFMESHFPMVLVDLNDMDFQPNKAFKKLFGYSDKEFSSLEIMELTHADDRKRSNDEFMKLSTGKIATIDMEKRYLKKNGSIIWGHTGGATIKNEKGEITGVILMIIDITKEKIAAEESFKLLTAIEQLSESVVIADVEGRIQYTNSAFEKISGYSKKEVIGNKPNILKSGKHEEGFYKQLWQTILAGKTWSGKIVNRKKNGENFEEKVNISPVKDKDGNIVNFVAVKQDITRERVLEEQLIQSQKLETIGTLAGGIAHDFNNILGTLIGYNDMIAEEVSVDSEAQEYIDSMKIAMERAKGLINQILTFSRKMEPESKPVNLADLLTESINLFRLSLTPDIKVLSSICTKCHPISLDASQMQQVFMNLLTNASHAVNSKDGVIEVGLEMVDNTDKLSGQYPELTTEKLIKFHVRDNGAGMKEEVRSRIFEPFFTTKVVGKGTGLGLSVVHGIITAHKGIIEVDSEPESGTSFTIYLPLT